MATPMVVSRIFDSSCGAFTSVAFARSKCLACIAVRTRAVVSGNQTDLDLGDIPFHIAVESGCRGGLYLAITLLQLDVFNDSATDWSCGL